MKFKKFLGAFLPLFFILIGIEQVFGMQSVSEKCEVCEKGECNFFVFDEQMLVDLKKVCGWNCAISYINRCRNEFGDDELKAFEEKPKCSCCKSKLSDKDAVGILKCGCVICQDCRVSHCGYMSTSGNFIELCPVCNPFGKPLIVFGNKLQSFFIAKNTKENIDVFSAEISSAKEAKDFRDFLKSNQHKLAFKVEDGVKGYKTLESRIAILAMEIFGDYCSDIETFKDDFDKLKKISFHMIERDKYQIRYE